MSTEQPRAYRFGDFRVDLVRHCITGPAGETLVVSSRAYDALLHLIEHRDRVVTKDELMKAVWPRAVVEENNLNQAISILRRALGDTRESPRYLATIPGRGYRFVAQLQLEFEEQDAPVAPMVPSPEPAHADASSAAAAASPARADAPVRGRRQLLLAAAGAGLAAVAGGGWWIVHTRRASKLPRSIAVLPFKPLVDRDRDEALELGIAETLINRLSLLPGVTVTPLSSVRRFAGSDQDPLAAGRDLDVAAVIEGHVQLGGGRVRLTARLLHVGDGAALWSGSFDERADDFFAVEDAVAQQLVDALAVDLGAEGGRQLTRHYTESVEAWQLYLNGRYYWESKSPDGFRKAIQFYEAAERVDPRFPLPAAGLADVWAVFGVFGILPPATAFASAQAAAERAIALDPQLAEAIAALGHIQVQRWRRWNGGERLYRRALDIMPRYAQAVMWLANDHVYRGKLSDGLAAARLAQSMEPMSVTFAANVGMVQYYARDFEAALRQLTGLVETTPQSAVARNHLARLYCAVGQPARALELLKNHSEPAPGALANPGIALALAGQVDAARSEIARIEDLGRSGFGVGYDLALIHASLGEAEPALDALERGATDLSQTIGFMNSEPRLDPIRGDPRFKAVSRSIGLG